MQKNVVCDNEIADKILDSVGRVNGKEHIFCFA